MGREKITITKRKAKGVLADMIANMDEESLAKTREKMINMKEQQETKTGLQEDYCSKEVRNLLVTKGFMGDMWYDNDDIHISHALAMKWLRKKHIYICPVPAYFHMDYSCSWDCDIWADDNYEESIRDKETYEEAVEAALKYSLENLVRYENN